MSAAVWLIAGCAGGTDVEGRSASDVASELQRAEPSLLAFAEAAKEERQNGGQSCRAAPPDLRAGDLGTIATICVATTGPDHTWTFRFLLDASNQWPAGFAYMASGGDPRIYDACVRSITPNWTQYRVSGNAEPDCGKGFHWVPGG